MYAISGSTSKRLLLRNLNIKGIKMKEIWKTIEECPNYAVSNHGRVKRIVSGGGTTKGRILKSNSNRHGYVYVSLMNNGQAKYRRVSRLVLQAFVGDPPKGKECNHINGVKANNRVENLEWRNKNVLW